MVTVVWPDPADPIDECDCPDPSSHDRLRGGYARPATSDPRVILGPGDNRLTLRAEGGAAGWHLPRRSHVTSPKRER